jgi:penicillin G amidase
MIVAMDDVTVPRPRRKLLRRILLAFALLLVLLFVGGWWYVRTVLTASLPKVDGIFAVEGVTHSVRIERDARGVPTIHGQSWADLAYGLGVVHAQDRFFQMDLLRRKAAGELAELVGPVAVGMDMQSRVHRFRSRMRASWAQLSESEKTTIKAYVAGVNWVLEQGLQSPEAKPFEYHLLRTEPKGWDPEDSFLVVCAMYQALQLQQINNEKMRADIAAAFPAEVARFLDADGSEWDAPIDQSKVAVAPLPSARVLNVRKATPDTKKVVAAVAEEIPVIGSNNWAVAGRRTRHGGALVADDMHLQVQLPNIWYRACLVWTDPDGTARRACGVTLPGGPAVVAGSNGYVAWGFTNTEGNWLDLLRVDRHPKEKGKYRGPQGWLPITKVKEEIKVKNMPSVSFDVEETIWGPIGETDNKGRPYAVRWVAQEPGAVNLRMGDMLKVRTIEEALRLAPECGIPHQNLVCADRSGRIAWTIIGKIPRRVGKVTRGATAALEQCRWDGFLDADDYPRVVDPQQGCLWSANNRVVGGAMWETIGNGGVDAGLRAGQIRDRLLALENASEADLLRIQLDDEARSFRKWQQLFLEEVPYSLTDARKNELRRLVESWDGRAGAEGVGYRILHSFRNEVRDLIMDPLRSEMGKKSLFTSNLGAGQPQQLEGVLWTIITARPEHLLHARYPSWNALFQEAADDVLTMLQREGKPLDQCTWGRSNTTLVRHPLSEAVPLLGRWLDVAPAELSGARFDLPRITSPGHGASQRFVVSPGREEEGIFHMPGGQSGHPFSPHYADGHADWEQGKPTPFLPGPKVHELVFEPKR